VSPPRPQRPAKRCASLCPRARSKVLRSFGPSRRPILRRARAEVLTTRQKRASSDGETGRLLGTPPTWRPSRAAAGQDDRRAQSTSGRSGAVLYECLVGKRAFDAAEGPLFRRGLAVGAWRSKPDWKPRDRRPRRPPVGPAPPRASSDYADASGERLRDERWRPRRGERAAIVEPRARPAETGTPPCPPARGAVSLGRTRHRCCALAFARRRPCQWHARVAGCRAALRLRGRSATAAHRCGASRSRASRMPNRRLSRDSLLSSRSRTDGRLVLPRDRERTDERECSHVA
jgi:hypothetical protein